MPKLTKAEILAQLDNMRTLVMENLSDDSNNESESDLQRKLREDKEFAIKDAQRQQDELEAEINGYVVPDKPVPKKRGRPKKTAKVAINTSENVATIAEEIPPVSENRRPSFIANSKQAGKTQEANEKGTQARKEPFVPFKHRSNEWHDTGEEFRNQSVKVDPKAGVVRGPRDRGQIEYVEAKCFNCGRIDKIVPGLRRDLECYRCNKCCSVGKRDRD